MDKLREISNNKIPKSYSNPNKPWFSEQYKQTSLDGNDLLEHIKDFPQKQIHNNSVIKEPRQYQYRSFVPTKRIVGTNKHSN